MYCNTSISIQIARGVLALTCIAGAVMLAPHFWPAAILVAAAFVLMRGCPACWLMGLLEAIESRKKRPRQESGARRAPR